MPNKISATLAMSYYDHVGDLLNGQVQPEGIDLTALRLNATEVFHRFIHYREWEISEMSMAKYVSIISQGDSSLTAIPVFPSRMFRQSSIYVRPDGPRHPSELAGARVGIPEWAQTATVYMRGFMVDQYGVALDSIEWVQAGLTEPGRAEKVPLNLPPGVQCRNVRDRTLQELLFDGEVDALFSAQPPSAYVAGDPNIKRMFDAPVPVEQEYYSLTGVYPIMHVIAMRRDFVDAHPWAPMNMLQAFEESKRRCVERLLNTGASRTPVPWAQYSMLESQQLLGWDKEFWPYGVEPNRVTLETFLRWCAEQGVTTRKVELEELFPPQLATRVKI
ncbi:MAG TPA: hypothetical protein VHZ03_22345 [Trebonia sp.]|nr:hypothetical protein [Trebonia sp.]